MNFFFSAWKLHFLNGNQIWMAQLQNMPKQVRVNLSKTMKMEDIFSNNNNEYLDLECLTCTGPKCLYIFYKYILSKFNAYNMNAPTCMHTHRLAHAHRCARTHTHTPAAYQGNQGNETEEKVFKKRKVFQEDLKELTEVEWQTEMELVLNN